MEVAGGRSLQRHTIGFKEISPSDYYMHRITIATDAAIVVSSQCCHCHLCKMLVKQLKFAFVYHERRSLNFEAHNLVGLCWSIGSKTWMV
jgi:hypothetical protein